MQDQMEQRLSQCPELNFDDEPQEEIKVAVTTFAFNNYDIIEKLKQRGKAIKYEKWAE